MGINDELRRELAAVRELIYASKACRSAADAAVTPSAPRRNDSLPVEVGAHIRASQLGLEP